MRYAAIFSILLLAGCSVTHGQPIDTNLVGQLEQNIATQADATKLLGAPRATSLSGDGTAVLIWSYVHATSFGGAESTTVYLTFGPDGRLSSKNVSVTKQ